MAILLKDFYIKTIYLFFAGLEEPDDVTPAATNTSLVSRGTRRQTYQLYSENQNKSYGNNFGRFKW